MSWSTSRPELPGCNIERMFRGQHIEAHTTYLITTNTAKHTNDHLHFDLKLVVNKFSFQCFSPIIY